LFFSLFEYFLLYFEKHFLLALYQFLYNLLLKSSERFWAHIVLNALNPLGVSIYPTNPTAFIGGVSITVTASITSFLSNFECYLATSLKMWVIPALYPTNAVRWGGFLGSSLGNERILPLWCLVLFLGKNPNEPCLGASNLRWLIEVEFVHSLETILKKTSSSYSICRI